jgi:hypothetical protein
MLDSLYTICQDDLYYCVLLVYTSMMSFGLGLVLGGFWILAV